MRVASPQTAVALETAASSLTEEVDTPEAYRLQEFHGPAHIAADQNTSGMQEPAGGGDEQLELRIELGQAMLSLNQIMELRSGSVVRLDSTVEQPADLYIDERLVARGEIVVLHEQFGLRITHLVSGGAHVHE